MTDAVSILRDNHAKLALRVKKLRLQLEAAEHDLVEMDTAMRVLSRLGIAPAVEPPDTDEGPSRASDAVFAALGIGEKNGLAPKAIEIPNVQPDNVRTILGRLVQRGKIETRDGKYWRSEQSSAKGTNEGSEIASEPSVVRREEPSTTSEIPILSTPNDPDR